MAEKLEEMTARSLRKLAKDRGVKNTNVKTKEQLLAELAGAGEGTHAAATAEEKEAIAHEKMREISKLASGLAKAEDKLASVRKDWNGKVAQARKALKELLAADLAEMSAKDRLVAIQEAYQHQEEMEAGRSEATAPLVEKTGKLRTQLKQEIEDSNQLGLRF